MRWKLSPLTGIYPLEREVPNGDPNQSKGGMADGGGHASDLAVFPFGERQRNPGIRNLGADPDGWSSRGDRRWWSQYGGLSREAPMSLYFKASIGEAMERLRRGNSFDLSIVGLGLFRSRVEQAIDKRFFIAQQKETF